MKKKIENMNPRDVFEAHFEGPRFLIVNSVSILNLSTFRTVNKPFTNKGMTYKIIGYIDTRGKLVAV